jgi:hypothetical protein
MKVSLNDAYNMTVSDRKDFIKIHNKLMNKQKERMGGK